MTDRADDGAEGEKRRVITNATVAWLIVAIAVTDIITTRFEPPHSDAFVKTAIVVGFVVWARRYARLSWDELGLARSKVASGARVGAVAFLIVGGGIALLVALPATRSYFASHNVAHDSTAQRVLEPLVFIPLGTVVFEEVIFRGVLLGALLRNGSRRRAILISAAAFGCWHIPPALTDAGGKGSTEAIGIVAGTIAITAVAGVLFVYLRLRSGSLLAPMLGHLATNSVAYVAAIVALQL
jgi:uncharacterized protein